VESEDERCEVAVVVVIFGLANKKLGMHGILIFLWARYGRLLRCMGKMHGYDSP
jgi:hypothetical protein